MTSSGFDESFQRQLATSSWALYSIGMFVIILRTFARWRRVRSVSLLAPDDWLMMTLVPVFYTTLIVSLNITAAGGGSNLYPPEQFSEFTEEDIQERIKGSKIVLVSEQAMLNLIWTLKACMLFMFSRMMTGTRHVKFVKYLSIYVALGWVAMEITFFTVCRPFKGYWAMPPPDPQCTTFEHYAMIQAVLNLSSDVGMLFVPIPMLVSLSLPLKQKLVLAVVFSMGIFVIIAAILTKVYNLSDVYSPAYMLWYTREASVAVYVTNLPGIWPLLREYIPFLRNHTSYRTGGSSGLPQYGNGSSHHRLSRKQPTITNANEDELELGRRSFSKSTTRSIPSTVKPESEDERPERLGHFGRKLEHLGMRRGSPESDERVLNAGSAEGSGWGKGFNLEVHIDKTIEVERGSWDGSVRDRGNHDRERFKWEVATQAPKVKIEGPEGEIVDK